MLSRTAALGALVALVSACMAPDDDAASSSDAIEIADGCPRQLSCDARNLNGELCIPLCDARCATTHREAALWVSPYEVAGTYGFGRHQGLALVTVDSTFDARFSLSALKRSRETQSVAIVKEHSWPAAPVIGGLPADMVRPMLPEGQHAGHYDAARCGQPTISLDRPLANHGRPLARAPSDAGSRSRMLVSVTDFVGPAKNDAIATRTSQCLDKISNGFCDSVCGNCSYVLPEDAILTSSAGDWSKPTDRLSGDGTCGGESYYGGPGNTTQGAGADALANPFTHCARLGCVDGPTEAPSLKTLVSTAPVSGLFGHNSNSDAEAEYLAFQGCMTGAAGVTDACKACGETTAVGRQSPCLSKTNSARSIWTRTATPRVGPWFADNVPAIQHGSTESSPPAPMCRWGGFPVNGM